MLKTLFAGTALAASALVVPAASAAPALAAVSVQKVHAVSAHACTYRRDGKVWRCVTPGAYCPKAAHLHYGYAKVTGKRYKCLRYSNGAWRWKRY